MGLELHTYLISAGRQNTGRAEPLYPHGVLTGCSPLREHSAEPTTQLVSSQLIYGDQPLFFNFLLLFKYSCLYFSPTTTPQPQPSSLPTLDPTSLQCCPCVLYTCSLTTLPPFPSIIPSHLPSDYCQFVLYFNVSGYILLGYLFCCLG